MNQVAPQVQADLTALLLKLSHDKRTRKLIAKAIKEIEPESPHANAFADVDVEDRFEAFRAEQEQKELKRAQDEMLSRMNQKRAALLTGGPDGSGRKYAEEDVKKIEELMQRKGLTDYEDGAVIYASTLPPPEQPSGAELPPQHGATWEFPEWSKYSTDPVKASRDTAHTVITEFMRKR